MHSDDRHDRSRSVIRVSAARLLRCAGRHQFACARPRTSCNSRWSAILDADQRKDFCAAETSRSIPSGVRTHIDARVILYATELPARWSRDRRTRKRPPRKAVSHMRNTASRPRASSSRSHDIMSSFYERDHLLVSTARAISGEFEDPPPCGTIRSRSSRPRTRMRKASADLDFKRPHACATIFKAAMRADELAVTVIRLRSALGRQPGGSAASARAGRGFFSPVLHQPSPAGEWSRGEPRGVGNRAQRGGGGCRQRSKIPNPFARRNGHRHLARIRCPIVLTRKAMPTESVPPDYSATLRHGEPSAPAPLDVPAKPGPACGI